MARWIEVECTYCGGTGSMDETIEGSDDPDEPCSQCGGDGTIEVEEEVDDDEPDAG